MDTRKAARVLRNRKGGQVVKVLISISSPHRGTPVAKNFLDAGPGAMNDFLVFLSDYLVSPLLAGKFRAGDIEASMKAFVYEDYDPNDGIITGVRAFNEKYGIDDTCAAHYASVITADEEDRNLILQALGLLADNTIDANGWCGTGDVDCNDDGAAGSGNGDARDGDDDGLVGINSQQMGHRLTYKERLFFDSIVTIDAAVGYVEDINNPDKTQSVSMSSVLNEDHIDVVGLGAVPFLATDDFDEKGFYAALIDYIAENEDAGDISDDRWLPW